MFEKARSIQLRRELDGEQGFTLIELLIVIVVLGILAAIVVFALGGVTTQSAVAACNSDAKTVSIAVSAYQASPQNAGANPPNILALVNGGELKSAPNNSAYAITTSGGNTQVQLTASTDPALAQSWTGADEVAGSPVANPGVVTSTTGTPSVPTLYNYDGPTAFVYGTTTTPTADQGQNICAGA